MMTVAVLGEVEVRRDGVPVPVPMGKTTELLVRLAVDVGARVRTEVLLDDLWTDPAGRNTLQSKVSQLRRSLGDKGLVESSGDGYRLALDPGCVDSSRAVALELEASAAKDSGDAATTLDKAAEGFGLFHGEPLLDAGDWAGPHRARLEEVRLGLLEDVMSARVTLGAGAELVGELEGLVALYPLRERLWASLITALYRSGRQADALAAYTRVRTVLVDELGIEPGAQLRVLEQQVLRQSHALGGRDTLATSTPRALPGNLPGSGAVLVGRESDLARAAALTAEHRLVTVLGPAGVGKTALALALARAAPAPGGAWLVRLETVDATVSLRRVIAETLHLPGGEGSLDERLAGAETLLLLDSCEHLIEPVGALADALLASVPGLQLIATSQAPLGIEEERLHHLQPLSTAQSIELFGRRARDLREEFALDETTRTSVEAVCRSLDGLPLAIELAAARVRSMSVPDIARRLDHRFAVLQDPSSHRPERRRALEGAIRWSYELLFPDDQRGLWAVACFAGDASLDGVERVLVALGVPIGAVVDTLTRLVDRSLVILDIVEGGRARYRLLDSIRAFAVERLEESGELDTGLAALAGWYAETAAWCDAHVRTALQPECLVVARAERANADAALAWCRVHDPDLGARIANGFGWTWVVLGDGTAGAARLRTAVTPSTSAADRARGLLVAGWLEASAGDLALAQHDLDSAQADADALGDDLIRADIARHRAFLAIQQGRPDVVLEAAAASLATYRAEGLDWQAAGATLLGAYGSLMSGDTEAAELAAVEVVDTLTRVGDSWALVHAQALIGGIAQAEHRFADAATALHQAAEQSRVLGFPGQAALHLASLGRVQQRAGEDRLAMQTFERAIADARAGGDGRLAATARFHLARVLRKHGDGAAALALLQENRRWYDRAGHGEGALLTRCVLHAVQGDGASLQAVLAEAVSAGNDEVRLHALDALARCAAADGDRVRARTLLAEADGLQPVVAHVVDDSDRFDRSEALRLLSAGPAPCVRGGT